MTNETINLGVSFDNSYVKQMDGFYAQVSGDVAPAPSLIALNKPLAAILGINNVNQQQLAEVFSASALPMGAQPIAQKYAGHQFGSFNPGLGDGRALLLGEVIGNDQQRYDIQLKGSGRTPYSRGGDGKAVLGPILREYLISEAMHAMNIPTTRALAAVKTGEKVMRSGVKEGAVIARVASSHLRVGTFQAFAHDPEMIKQLADYCIQRHYPEVLQSETPYLDFLIAVRDKQALLVAKWLSVGFVHGVMNTDNMTISGETIDYGPCAFIDNYDANALFSSIDANGRYAFENQPPVAQWNLARLAETILTLIDQDEQQSIEKATQVINDFTVSYQAFWLANMREKIGLSTAAEGDSELINQMLQAMQNQQVDYTLFFRSLAHSLKHGQYVVSQLFTDTRLLDEWYSLWLARINKESISVEQRIKNMNQVNPLYIPRNHLVDEMIVAAEAGDLSYFDKLMLAVTNPYQAADNMEKYAQAPNNGNNTYTTYCGT
ncbi:protein adenylyltransferase SelO [Psychromonas aquatilis]|uniref:Protein nucleotidyltransferase YdiU n=1 Tax=Psychromonas aquatilis TaxID=2005072 RepID=A0ABU9GLY8_9GAMM